MKRNCMAQNLKIRQDFLKWSVKWKKSTKTLAEVTVWNKQFATSLWTTYIKQKCIAFLYTYKSFKRRLTSWDLPQHLNTFTRFVDIFMFFVTSDYLNCAEIYKLQVLSFWSHFEIFIPFRLTSRHVINYYYYYYNFYNYYYCLLRRNI